MSRETELEQEQIIADYKTVLKTASGRRLLWHIVMVICGNDKSAENVSNVNVTFFELGKRKVAKGIIKRINNIDPMFMFKMARENTKK